MFHQRRAVAWPCFAPRVDARFARTRHHRDDDGGSSDWGWPPFGPFGRSWRRPSRQSGRLFDRGDLKYVILDLLRERPRHGYDIIRALEERVRGFYSPSPGTVYPTLQLLEDQGFVTSSQQDSKRVYTLTEAGRALLAERADTLAGIRRRMAAGRGAGAHGEVHAVMGELRDLAQTVFRQASRGAFSDPESARRLRAALARAREEIEAIAARDPEPHSTTL